MRKLTMMTLVSLGIISSAQAALVKEKVWDGVKGLGMVATIAAVRTIPVVQSALKVEDSTHGRNFGSPLAYACPGTNVAARIVKAIPSCETADHVYNWNTDVQQAEKIRLWANRISAALYAGLFSGAVASLYGKTLPTYVQKIFGSKLQAATLCAASGIMLCATLPYLKSPYKLWSDLDDVF